MISAIRDAMIASPKMMSVLPIVKRASPPMNIMKKTRYSAVWYLRKFVAARIMKRPTATYRPPKNLV